MAQAFRDKWKDFNKVSLGLPALFLLPFFLLFARVQRFEDENYAIINGRNIIVSLFSSDPEQKSFSAGFDAITGVGTAVSIPAGIVFALSGDVLITRLVSAVYAYLFWLGIVLSFLGFCRIVAPEFKFSQAKAAIMAFTVLCFVQAMPESYASQATTLAEYPGAALLGLAFAALLWRKPMIGVFLASVALTAKFNYVVYGPFFIGAAIYASPTRNLGTVLKTIAVYLTLPFGVQLLKLMAFGPTEYLRAWSPYLEWFIHSSGSGLGAHNPEFTEPHNEWPHYSWRKKAYYLIGTFAPLCACIYYGVIRKVPKSFILGLAAFAAIVLAGSYQWWFIGVVQWWRRTHYFLVPGYAVGIFAIVLEIWRIATGNKRLLKIIPVMIVVLALYVQIRQSIIGTWQNTSWMPQAKRHMIDWRQPIDESVADQYK